MCLAIMSALLLSAPLAASAQTPTDLLGTQPPRNLLGAPSLVADAPVTLADATSFEAPLVSEIDDGEITDARRELASAVSAGKYLAGARAVLAGALILAFVF